MLEQANLTMPDITKTGLTLAGVEENEQKIRKISSSIHYSSDDPIRMYLQDMKALPLLTKKGEVEIAKIIEQAKNNISKVIFATGMLMAGVSALNKIKKMFKDSNVETELAALGMDLKGNPTSKMGHLMFKIASDSFVGSLNLYLSNSESLLFLTIWTCSSV